MASIPQSSTSEVPGPAFGEGPAFGAYPPSAPAIGYTAEGQADWEGPRVKVKITADQTTVVTSTDVIGKADFGQTLFKEKFDEKLKEMRERKKQERKKKERMSEEEVPGSEDAKDEEDSLHSLLKEEDEMMELWFDRSGYSLPIIMDVCRGYDCSEMELNKHQIKMILSDCEFYRLPKILMHLFPEEIQSQWIVKEAVSISGEIQSMDPSFKALEMDRSVREFDSNMVNPDSFVCLGSLLRKVKDNRKWQMVGITGIIHRGWNDITFEIKKTTLGAIVFGVMPMTDFVLDGQIGAPVNAVGLNVYDNTIRNVIRDESTELHKNRGKSGDVITMRVFISDERSESEITFIKNGTVLAVRVLGKYIDVNKPLIFCVNVLNTPDEIHIKYD